MLSASALLVFFFSLLVARADVVPSEPAPGRVYTEGQNCSFSWDADPSATKVWTGMNVELMTGDNFNMIHLTTVAQKLDGTQAGNFQYPCPQVDIHSAIYFYQFSAPMAANKTWTTRFTIAPPSGQTAPPPNPTQPNTGDAIPWGVGHLIDASQAVPPPASAGGPASAPGNDTQTPSSLPLASSSIVIPTSTPAVSSTSSRLAVSTVPSTPSAAPTTDTLNNNQASAAVKTYAQIYSIGSLAVSVLAFTLFL